MGKNESLEKMIRKIHKEIKECNLNSKLSSLDSVYIALTLSSISTLLSAGFLLWNSEMFIVIYFSLMFLLYSLYLRIKVIYTETDKINTRMRSDFFVVYSFFFGIIALLSIIFRFEEWEITQTKVILHVNLLNPMIFGILATLLLCGASYICVKINECYIKKFPQERDKLIIRSKLLLFYLEIQKEINKLFDSKPK